MFWRKKKQVIKIIQCTKDPSHEFKREFTIYEGTEGEKTSDVQLHCAECETLLAFTIDGEIVPDTSVFRSAREV